MPFGVALLLYCLSLSSFMRSEWYYTTSAYMWSLIMGPCHVRIPEIFVEVLYLVGSTFISLAIKEVSSGTE